MDQELSATLDGETVIVGGYLQILTCKEEYSGDKTLNTRTGNPNNKVVEIKGRES